MSDLKQIAAEVRTWLEANFDPSLSLREWREILVDSGWGAPDFPTEYYGRGLDASAVATVNAEFARVGAVGQAKSLVRGDAPAVPPVIHGHHPPGGAESVVAGEPVEIRRGRPAVQQYHRGRARGVDTEVADKRSAALGDGQRSSGRKGGDAVPRFVRARAFG